MRWNTKAEILGTERTIKKFLWFPKVIGLEWRWLERAEWLEQAVFYDGPAFAHNAPMPTTQKTARYRWSAKRWL